MMQEPASDRSMGPPARFAGATFATYDARGPTQVRALREARAFVADLRRRRRPLVRLCRRLRRAEPARQGLYLVGPVGTGKTHLLAACYHELHPEVPCAFLHASRLFRSTQHPETYARRLAQRFRVLCLDEMEIDDAANEARLVLVLRTLGSLGVTLLATSNVEPGAFLSTRAGTHRFQRFLDEEFRARYQVLVVGGDDYRKRLDKPGRAWVGPGEATRAAMRHAYDAEDGRRRWIDYRELLDLATNVEHTRLVDRLLAYDHLYLADLAPDGTDEALRLLRLVDDVYQAPDPPVLYFTSPTHPDDWMPAEASHAGLERAVAEKFTRTTSRLTALCEVERL